MRILVLTDSIGGNAAGIVTNTLLNGLDQLGIDYEVMCITSSLDKKHIHLLEPGLALSERLRKVLLILFNQEFKYPTLEKRAMRLVKEKHNLEAFDVTLCITTGARLHMISIGQKLKKYSNIPFIIHSMDPLPTQAHWGGNLVLGNAIAKLVRKIYREALGFSATNEKMLEYQRKIVGLPMEGITVFNPIESSFRNDLSILVEPSFLFLGAIYGARNPSGIIDAFLQLQADIPIAKLTFVGQFRDIDRFDIANNPGVSVKGFVKDVDPEIKASGILLDIDANHRDDVFLSSKFTGYLKYPRIILCITTGNSASSALVKRFNLNSVVVTNHESENVLKAMETAFSLARQYSSEAIEKDRRGILEFLRSKVQVKRLIDYASQLLDPKS